MTSCTSGPQLELEPRLLQKSKPEVTCKGLNSELEPGFKLLTLRLAVHRDRDKGALPPSTGRCNCRTTGTLLTAEYY